MSEEEGSFRLSGRGVSPRKKVVQESNNEASLKKANRPKTIKLFVSRLSRVLAQMN